jgi:hypothetical protein
LTSERTPRRPTSTAADDAMSDEKCRASASRAWLDVSLAVRDSARARKKSIAIETRMTANAAGVASTA